MDWTLGIDTSTARAFAALAGPGGLYERASSGENSHHEELAQLVDGLVRDAGLAPRSIARLVVGAGPGSFTGLRIGYSFARGLAAALGVPMFGVSSLRGAAWEFRERGGIIVSALDARRGELFVEMFRAGEAGLVSLGEAAIVEAAELEAKAAAAAKGAPVFYMGQGIPAAAQPKRVAYGVIEAWRAEGRTSPHPRDEAPEYLRAVAAKTIAERNGGLSS